MMKTWTYDTNYVTQARKVAHLSAFLPLWGIFVAWVCFKFVSVRRPELKPFVLQAILWQIVLNLLHFISIGTVMFAYLVWPPAGSAVPTIVGISVGVIWFTSYTFGLIAAIAAAKATGTGERYFYPIISAFFRHERRRESRSIGSNFYPF